VSGFAIAVLSPILVAIALAIKIDTRGPALYRGRRIGTRGTPFAMLKFRTMVVEAEKLGGPSTPNGDPRITRVGAYLRKYKLDELPQLFNVLNGEMTLVGPRPEVAQYVAMFTHEERQILDAKPGITDLATMWNSDEGTLLAAADDPERMYLEVIRPRKIQLQLEYVRTRNFWGDLRIIWQTFAIVAGRKRPARPLTS
jgi:lipopolysaccharide/colanic/teichoic acid biosynthesis glycosyltransferase